MTGSAAEVMARAAALGEISEEPDRLTRRFATPALARAGELVAAWMDQAGMTTRRDEVGNVIGRYGVGDRPLVLGSHLDTVPNAGRFDGPLGVLAAIAVVQRLATGHEPSRGPIEVVAFADEEGARYGVPYLGSAAYAGAFDSSWLDLMDADGISVADAIRAIGGDPQVVVSAATPALAGYLEVHIEQGPVLEAEGLPVGVVTSIAGQSRATLTLRGRTGHAGTVPMVGRRDALVAAAEVILAIERIGQSRDGLVATVGTLSVSFGASNVVPAEALLSVDARHPVDDVRRRAVDEMQREVQRIADARNIEWEWAMLQESDAVAMTPALRDRLAAAVAVDHPVRELVSGAGHDAVVLSRICPVAMLFVRCAGGISHDPRETVAEEDVAVALDVLERCVRAVP